MALRRPVEHTSDPELVVFDAAPSDRDIPIALLGGFWAFANLYRLAVPAAHREELQQFYRTPMPQFFKPHAQRSA